MAEYRRAFQQPDPTGPDRWSIQGGDYRWYLPDLLTGCPLILSAETQEQLQAVTQQVTDLGRRFLVYRSPAILDLLVLTERRLGSAEIDTVTAPLSTHSRRRSPQLPTHLRRST